MNLFWVYVFFFLSGATGLIYEVLWFRLLKLEFGSLTITAAFLFAVFLSGLAIGAALTNRWLQFDSQRSLQRRYLFGYGVVEIIIGLFALLTLLLIPWAGDIHFTYNSGISTPLTYTIDLLLFSLILLPPTILMGFTYPLLSEWCESKSSSSGGRQAAILYCINVLGGGCGAMAAGFLLIPYLGMTTSMGLTAALNILLGGAALSLHRQGIGRTFVSSIDKQHSLDDEETTAKEIFLPEAMLKRPYQPPLPQYRRLGLALLAFLSGWLFLALEIIGNRSLQLIFGSTTYTFSVILFCVLVGIAIGAFTLSRFAQRIKHETRLLTISAALLPIAVAWVELSGRLNAYLFLYLHPWIVKSYAMSFWRDQLVKLSLCMISYLPPFIISGFLFASLLRLIGNANNSRGDDWSKLAAFIYKVNTFGSVVACLLLPLLLIGHLPMRQISLLLIIVSLSFLWIALWTIKPAITASNNRREQLLLCLLSSMALLLHFKPFGNPHLIHSGIFLRAPQFREQWLSGTLNKELSKRQWRYFSEGRDATILVEQDGPHLAFYVNGRPEATTQVVDKSNQYLLSLIPFLLHGPFQSSAVVALGAGMTAGIASELSGTTDVIEINDKVPDAAAQFAETNFNIVDKFRGKFGNDRTRIVIEDGRHFLQGTKNRYDLLTSDPLHPFTVGATNLYSLEYFQICRDRLKPGGYFTHWLPLYQVGTPQFAEIVKSFTTVFENGTVWLTHKDSILVARKDDSGDTSRQPIQVEWRNFENNFRIASRMFQAIGIETPQQALALYMRRPVNWFLPDTALVTDNSQSLEFSLPYYLYVDTVQPNVETLLTMREIRGHDPVSLNDLIKNPPRDFDKKFPPAFYAVTRFTLLPSSQITLQDAQRLDLLSKPYKALHQRFIESLFRHANLIYYSGNVVLARQLLSPYAGFLDANLLQIEWFEREQQPDKAFALAKNALRKFPESHWLHYVVGREALSNDRFQEAIEHFKTAIKLDPLREIQPEAQNQLAITYYELNDMKTAALYARQSLQLDPTQLRISSLLNNTEKSGTHD